MAFELPALPYEKNALEQTLWNRTFPRKLWIITTASITTPMSPS